MLQLCIPVTDIFRRNQESLLPLVGAVSFKQATDELFIGKERMLECSLNVADPSFPAQIEASGLLHELQHGQFSSFACDLGPASLAFTTGESPNGFPRYLPDSEPVSETEYIEQANKNVLFLRTHFNGRIKLENLNYFSTGAYELVCDPEFISHVLHHLQVELLLDIAHLRISAHNLDVSVDKHLERLPLDLISEVQLSGLRVINGIWEDAHELPVEADFSILKDIVSLGFLEYVTMEYYRDDALLVSEYRKLFDFLM